MSWYGNHMSGWDYTEMGLVMVLIWVGVIAGIVALIRYGSGNQPGGPEPIQGAPSPERLLATRFAHGEIDDVQYRERLAVVRERAGQQPEHQGRGAGNHDL